VFDQEVEQRSRIKLVYEASLPPCELLISSTTNVVDCGGEIHVWIGKESTAYQRKLAAVLAKVYVQYCDCSFRATYADPISLSLSLYRTIVLQKLLADGDRPQWATIARVIDGGEPILFKEHFSNFPGMLPINLTKKEQKSNVAKAKTQECINVAQLHQEYVPTEVWSQMYDDGSGVITKVCTRARSLSVIARCGISRPYPACVGRSGVSKTLVVWNLHPMSLVNSSRPKRTLLSTAICTTTRKRIWSTFGKEVIVLR
jgi:hypothetical protein